MQETTEIEFRVLDSDGAVRWIRSRAFPETSIEAAIARLRHLLFEPRPRVLDQEGLTPALRMYLDQMQAQTGLEWSLESRLVTEPHGDTRTILYRIAQEALLNVRKHARASRVDLLLESGDGGISVRLRDDGVGFTPGGREAAGLGHLGLTAMRERAEMAGGRCRVESLPGGGTTVEFWLPGQGAPPEVAEAN